ncbi:hypothetical protein [Flavobacterium sp. N1994]|uniref:hypothetical protein n=1 Tax=Flavobacterium sp. N1994 TaxID=2986827 RepID=UPI0022238637|nr:hypothetical protein [Flavobacterium sp. N1994]
MLETVVYPVLASGLTAFILKIIEWRKNKAESKSTEIDNEAKSATFYQNLLDDATKRINQCLEIIDNLNGKITERDKIIETQDIEKKQLQTHIKELMDSIETLTTEIKKFKQLNGKTE